MTKKSSKEKDQPPSMEIHLDLIPKKAFRIPKVKMVDNWFYTVKDDSITSESSYDNIVEAIIDFVTSPSFTLIDEDPSSTYDIISTPVGMLFGRASPRRNKNMRATNATVVVTPTNLEDYINKCMVTLETKTIRDRSVGKDRKSVPNVTFPTKVVLDLACIVRITIPEKNNSTIGGSEGSLATPTRKRGKSPPPTFLSIPKKTKKAKKVIRIPRILEIKVLNPVMAETKERECGIRYSTSSTAILGSINFDLSTYIQSELDSDGMSIIVIYLYLFFTNKYFLYIFR